METILSQLVTWAQAEPDILALYLYGSLAENRANALSDVDIAILVREGLTKEQLWQLEKSYSAQ